MNTPSIRSIVRRNLLILFLIALFAGGGGLYFLLEQAAIDNATEQARMMLSSATGIRHYTDTRIVPVVAPMSAAVFHEETVPSFAAQTIFRSLSVNDNAYTYREAALNPTAPTDRAGPFEVDLIRQFRSDDQLKEKDGTIDQAGQRLFYLARPIRITDSNCLMCHDTPARAPHAMLVKYGSENGFGWHLNEIVGVQMVTVPVTREFKSTLEILGIMLGGLSLIFAIAYFALSASMEAAVVEPLAKLAAAADKASRSSDSSPDMPLGGAREIRTLAEAIQRLHISLAKALRLLSRPAGDGDG
jgi:hypothetical protein